jgi:flagellar biosynthetic protein FliQ
MTPTVVMEIAREAVTVTLLCALPLMLAALVVGLTVSVFQAASQINEATLSFVPKIIAVFVVLVLAGGWILEELVGFAVALYERIPVLIGVA